MYMTRITALILLLFTVPAHTFQVSNGKIVDQNEQTVQLRGVNWFGFETQDHVVHGLWARNWQDMIAQIKEQGFNAVRLPVCPDSLQGQSDLNINYALNPDLQGMNSQQVLDTFLNYLNSQGIYILLDHHRPDCNAISELWYTASYSEQAWIDDLVWMAERYKTLPYLIGIDLKNEPHGSATWGTGNISTDWNSAAERAATAILAQTPNLLIFVEGIQENPDCSGTINHWWGGNLEPLSCYPLNIPKENLVLSPHVYGPDVFNQAYFDDPVFPDNLPAIWDEHFGQFIDQGYAVIIGEFGGKYAHGGDVKDRAWQDALIDYLISKGVNSAFYWSWNPNSGDTGGILQDDWHTVWQDKVDLLNRFWGSTNIITVCADGLDNDGDGLVDFPDDPGCSSLADDNETDPSTTACADGIDNDSDGSIDYPDDPGCSSAEDEDETNIEDNLIIKQVTGSQWDSGYCKDVLISNPGSIAIDWRIEINIDGNLYDAWNVVYNQAGSLLTAEGESWNNIVQPGQTIAFGFCTNLSEPSPPAAICNDGLDNDGDGLIDFPADPGCSSTTDDDETDLILPACSDGVDNDSDSLIDFPTDPGCTSANDNSEEGELTSLVTELIINSDWVTGYCAEVRVINNSSAANDWNVSFDISGVINNLWNANYSQSGTIVNAEGLNWNNLVQANSSVTFGFCATK